MVLKTGFGNPIGVTLTILLLILLSSCSPVELETEVFFTGFHNEDPEWPGDADKEYLLVLEEPNKDPVLLSTGDRIIQEQHFPGKSLLLYQLYDGGGHHIPHDRGYDICVYDVAEDSTVIVARGFNANLSPDGSAITYTLYDSGYNLYRYSFLEDASELLVENVYEYGTPKLSSDGSRIIYTKRHLFTLNGWKSESGMLYVMDLEKGKKHPISPEDHKVFNYYWTLDGSSIVYFTSPDRRPRDSVIYQMNSETFATRELAEGNGRISELLLSSNGQSMLYVDPTGLKSLEIETLSSRNVFKTGTLLPFNFEYIRHVQWIDEPKGLISFYLYWESYFSTRLKRDFLIFDINKKRTVYRYNTGSFAAE